MYVCVEANNLQISDAHGSPLCSWHVIQAIQAPDLEIVSSSGSSEYQVIGRNNLVDELPLGIMLCSPCVYPMDLGERFIQVFPLSVPRAPTVCN